MSKYNKVCPSCGQPFATSYKRIVSCSRECGKQQAIIKNRNRILQDQADRVRIDPINQTAALTVADGVETIFDLSDLHLVLSKPWSFCPRTQYLTTYKGDGKGGLGLHRFINNTPPGLDPDHADGNRLNNCRSNLRTATRAQNQANVGLRADNTTGYKGVCWVVKIKRYKAQIRIENQKITLGYFTDPIEAALAYDQKAYEIHGDYAYLNFPERLEKKAA